MSIKKLSIYALAIFIIAEIILRATLYRLPDNIEEVPAVFRRAKSPPWTYSRDVALIGDANFGWFHRLGYKRKSIIPSGMEFWGENGELELSTVVINSKGFRGNEFFEKKTKGTYRIIALGDSWTFGMTVDEQYVYPQKLESLLNADFPDKKTEVLNFGVMAFTSLQGLNLVKEKLVKFEPDLIIIAYNTNDQRGPVAGFKNDTHLLKSGKRLKMAENLVYYSKVYELAIYYTNKYLKFKKPPKNKFEGDKPWWDFPTRNTPDEFRNNIKEIISTARKNNIDTLLLHHGGYLPYNFTSAEIFRISREEKVPLVNTQPQFHKRLQEIQKENERKFGLEPKINEDFFNITRNKEEIVFRVFLPKEKLSTEIKTGGRLSVGVIVRTNKGDFDLPLYDDGTHSDQVAGDQVWSATHKFTPLEQHRRVKFENEDGSSFNASLLYYLFTFRIGDSKRYYELLDEAYIYDPLKTHRWRTILIDPINSSQFIPFELVITSAPIIVSLAFGL